MRSQVDECTGFQKYWQKYSCDLWKIIDMTILAAGCLFFFNREKHLLKTRMLQLEAHK